MDASPPTRRRWFQFGLRELFWLILVVALSIAATREYRLRKQLERDVVEWEQQRSHWFEIAIKRQEDRKAHEDRLRQELRQEMEWQRRDLSRLGIDEDETAKSQSPTPCP